MYKVFKIFEIGVCEDEEITLPDGRIGYVKSAIKTPICQKRATSLTPTEIRKAIREAEYPLHKGQDVYCEEIESIKKYMDDDYYFEHSETVEE